MTQLHIHDSLSKHNIDKSLQGRKSHLFDIVILSWMWMVETSSYFLESNFRLIILSFFKH